MLFLITVLTEAYLGREQGSVYHVPNLVTGLELVVEVRESSLSLSAIEMRLPSVSRQTFVLYIGNRKIILS